VIWLPEKVCNIGVLYAALEPDQQAEVLKNRSDFDKFGRKQMIDNFTAENNKNKKMYEDLTPEQKDLFAEWTRSPQDKMDKTVLEHLTSYNVVKDKMEQNLSLLIDETINDPDMWKFTTPMYTHSDVMDLMTNFVETVVDVFDGSTSALDDSAFIRLPEQHVHDEKKYGSTVEIVSHGMTIFRERFCGDQASPTPLSEEAMPQPQPVRTIVSPPPCGKRKRYMHKNIHCHVELLETKLYTLFISITSFLISINSSNDTTKNPLNKRGRKNRDIQTDSSMIPEQSKKKKQERLDQYIVSYITTGILNACQHGLQMLTLNPDDNAKKNKDLVTNFMKSAFQNENLFQNWEALDVVSKCNQNVQYQGSYSKETTFDFLRLMANTFRHSSKTIAMNFKNNDIWMQLWESYPKFYGGIIRFLETLVINNSKALTEFGIPKPQLHLTILRHIVAQNKWEGLVGYTIPK
jgi:hypothetical protein